MLHMLLESKVTINMVDGAEKAQVLGRIIIHITLVVLYTSYIEYR